MSTLKHPSFVQFIKDRAGRPEYAVLPIDQYQALVRAKHDEKLGIPAAVIEDVVLRDLSPTRA